MNKVFPALLITALFLISVIPATVVAQEQDGYDGYFVHHNGKVYAADADDWTPFFKDTDSNGIDDRIEEDPAEKHDIFIKLEDIPTEEDVELIEEFTPVFYKALYTNTIICHGVDKDMIYSKLRYLDQVVFIEYVPIIKPFLDVSTENLKVRPNDLYNDVWDELGFDGTGVNIAVLDGGSNDHDKTADVPHISLDDMDDDPLTQDDLKFIAGWDWETLSGGEFINPHGDPLIGHGTHVAGTALGTGGSGEDSAQRGVAPGAQLIDMKVVTDIGAGGILIPAMEWCITNKDRDWLTSDTDGIQIMSMSLGGGESDGTDAMSQTANECVDAGLIVVVAAGNDGRNGYVTTPAAADKALCIAASDDKNTVTRDDDSVAGFSNKGPRNSDGDGDPYDELKPDVAAPGKGIMAPRADSYGAFVAMDGTSMATPHVSGVIALMLEANPDLTPAQVKTILHESAEAKGTPYNRDLSEKYNTAWGYGLVDAYKAVLMSQGHCDLSIEDVEAENVDNGKGRIDEGDDVRVTITLKEIEGFDANSYTLQLRDKDGDKLIKEFTGSLSANGETQHQHEFQATVGGDYNLEALITASDPEDVNGANNQMDESFYANYLPHSDIDANTTETMTLDEVRFDGAGSSDPDGTVKEYNFLFGDGEETGWQDENFAFHTYMDDGRYYVELKVRDDLGAESGPYTDSIRIDVFNRAPVAEAGDDLEGETGEEVDFKGSGTDKDGEVSFYEWDFDGDGSYDWSSSDSGETTHTYEEPGKYTARLRVTDDDDTHDTDELEVDITGGAVENLIPVADISEPEEEVVYFTDQQVTLDGSESYDPDGEIVEYTWSSDKEGQLYQGTLNKVNVDFREGGEHNVTLSVKDDRDAVDEAWVHIYVDNPPTPVIDAPENDEVFDQNDIYFDASSSWDKDEGDELTYKWSSDIDGVFYEGDEASFTATLSTGVHDIRFELSDPYTSRSKSVSIEIVENANTKPEAEIDDPVGGVIYSTDDSIFFNCTSSKDEDGDTLNFIWSSDIDGELYKGPKRTFSKKLSGGDHTITLSVSDGELTDEATVEFTVNTPPKAVIASLETGDTFFVGTNVDFDGTESVDPDTGHGSTLSYTWYLGEEELSSASSFQKVFTDKGGKDIRLVVEDQYGYMDDTTVTIFIIGHSVKLGFPKLSSNSVNMDPGEELTVELEVENKASLTDTVTIDLDDDPNVEMSITGPTEFQLEKNEKKTLQLKLNVSKSAPEGRADLMIMATAGEGDYAETTEEGLAVVVGDVLAFYISLGKSSITLDAGATDKTLKITIENNGNSDANFKVSADRVKDWEIKLSSSVFTLPAGQSKELTVTITAPETLDKETQTIKFNFEANAGEFTDSRTFTVKTGNAGSSGGGDDGGDDSPGFGTALAVVALLGVALVQWRRRR